MTEHPTYISGIRPLQGFSRSFDQNKNLDLDKAGILRLSNFLHFPVKGSSRDKDKHLPDFWLEKLALLGLASADDEFKASFFRLFRPYASAQQLRQDGLVLKNFIKACHDNGRDSFLIAMKPYENATLQ
jgi:hypothetical protein